MRVTRLVKWKPGLLAPDPTLLRTLGLQPYWSLQKGRKECMEPGC